jgi:hypothetical protein
VSQAGRHTRATKILSSVTGGSTVGAEDQKVRVAVRDLVFARRELPHSWRRSLCMLGP